jgi:phospholipid transport system transporter-binding protein
MTAILQKDNSWELSGDITMETANGLLVKSKLLDFSENAVIDFTKVEEVDTSAVSLMLEWRRRALAENKQLSFINMPEGLSSLTTLYDVSNLIS